MLSLIVKRLIPPLMTKGFASAIDVLENVLDWIKMSPNNAPVAVALPIVALGMEKFDVAVMVRLTTGKLVERNPAPVKAMVTGPVVASMPLPLNNKNRSPFSTPVCTKLRWVELVVERVAQVRREMVKSSSLITTLPPERVEQLKVSEGPDETIESSVLKVVGATKEKLPVFEMVDLSKVMVSNPLISSDWK